jgi:hypothetical protein
MAQVVKHLPSTKHRVQLQYCQKEKNNIGKGRLLTKEEQLDQKLTSHQSQEPKEKRMLS